MNHHRELEQEDFFVTLEEWHAAIYLSPDDYTLWQQWFQDSRNPLLRHLSYGQLLSVFALRFDQPISSIHTRLRHIQQTLLLWIRETSRPSMSD
ncbi:hypothetical protein [uncultured Marinococcus sp.]|uniref:hypothetical protein n=1 Tax=uncultured Marinococcus sp. TaxID=487012 RepID=UPI00261B7659|nr:hypothetical protein [uncultured Marinococcus sp.]